MLLLLAAKHGLNVQDYIVAPLDVGFRTRGDRLLLWLPMTITHTIDESSPLAPWMDSTDAVVRDDDSTIVVVVRTLGHCHLRDLVCLQMHLATLRSLQHLFGWENKRPFAEVL